MAKKILIVEDSESAAAMMVSQLQRAGFDLLVAPDAMIGTKECVRWRPDLVLLDLMVPAGGGLGVLRNMKKSVYTSGTPVLVITGSTDTAVRKQILEFGVSSILQKPYNPQELLALIHKALGLENPVPPQQ